MLYYQQQEFKYGKFSIKLTINSSGCDKENAKRMAELVGELMRNLDAVLNLNHFFSKAGLKSVLAKRINLLFKSINQGNDPEFKKLYTSLGFLGKQRLSAKSSPCITS